MKKSVLGVFLGFALVSTAFSQTYKSYSIYIYSFTRHIMWPETEAQGNFEIHVLGECPIMEELQVLADTKKVGERPIQVAQINSINEIRKCHILFVPAERSAELDGIISKINGGSTLIVTEQPGLGVKGSHINFVRKDGKLVFELNQNAASKNNLKVSSLLTSLAILI